MGRKKERERERERGGGGGRGRGEGGKGGRGREYLSSTAPLLPADLCGEPRGPANSPNRGKLAGFRSSFSATAALSRLAVHGWGHLTATRPRGPNVSTSFVCDPLMVADGGASSGLDARSPERRSAGTAPLRSLHQLFVCTHVS